MRDIFLSFPLKIEYISLIEYYFSMAICLRSIGVLLMLVIFTMGIPVAQAITLFSGSQPDANTSVTTTDTFILDQDNSATDVILQFGATLSETLKWNGAQNYFELSDALVVGGNLNANGTIFRLDFDNVGVGADLDIVAEQGADLDGTLRYSAANNRWEISNNGGVFSAIATGGAASNFEDMLSSKINQNNLTVQEIKLSKGQIELVGVKNNSI